MPAHERAQFRALTRAFMTRFFENELTAGTDDFKTSFIWLVSFLAVPGLFMPVSMALRWELLAFQRGPDVLRVLTRGDKAFYLGFVMVATAAITAIMWNTLLGDRRDALVLGVLPVRPPTIVAARLAALSMYMIAIGVAMNALASISFGFSLAPFNTFAFAVRGVVAHFVASVAASACVFLAVTGIQGLLLSAFGARVFARVAPAMQTVLIGLITAGFLSLPIIDVSVVDTLAGHGAQMRPWILVTPPLWFLGIYETVLGTTDPVLIRLTNHATIALVLGSVATLCTYPFAYRRVAALAVEQGIGETGRSAGRYISGLVTRSMGRAPHVRAVSQFFLATMGRVERHRFVIAASIGITLAWVMPGWTAMAWGKPSVPQTPLVSLSYSAMAFLIAGVATAASLPADQKAGWMFDVAPPGRIDAREALERILFMFGVLPVLIIFVPLYGLLWSRTFAFVHALFLIVFGTFLIQLALRRHAGMPCVRAWDPQRLNLGRWWGAYVLGFIIYTTALPDLELALYRHPIATAVFLGSGMIASVILRIKSLRRPQDEVDVSAFAPGDVLSLN